MDKWNEVKNYLRLIPDNLEFIIDDKEKSEPSNVKTIQDENRIFREWHHKYNGFDCYIRYQEDKKKDKTIRQIIAFNHELGVAYVRRPETI